MAKLFSQGLIAFSMSTLYMVHLYVLKAIGPYEIARDQIASAPELVKIHGSVYD